VYHYAGNNPVKLVDPNGRMSDEYNVELQVEGLKTKPVPKEKPLPRNLKEKLEDEGWIDITGDENARNEAAAELKEEVSDPNTKNHWYVKVYPRSESDTEVVPRTESEGANLRDGEGRPLQGITETTTFKGRIFEAYPQDGRGNIPSRPHREYYDVDGNGRIDMVRGNYQRKKK